jgi:hypothetical protein
MRDNSIGVGSGMTLPNGMTSATTVNLMERDPEPLDVIRGQVRVSLRPWQIRTVQFGR